MIQSKYSHPLHQLKALVTRLKVTKRIFDPLLQGTALAVDILLQKMMKILLNKNQVALACKEMTSIQLQEQKMMIKLLIANHQAIARRAMVSIQLQGTALELVMLIRTKILKN
ncbi:hypothetical protein Gohar_021488 [Gossypium harknessii]|uniref:Uncharacterized protein n=1 Tax=Gossypium harknessii TaxID=34285 RepID=A0A7J9I9L4_9ROSI|nr:hypothetical protein [Gossypium harknessii]